jgi:hypothetical protein
MVTVRGSSDIQKNYWKKCPTESTEPNDSGMVLDNPTARNPPPYTASKPSPISYAPYY